MNRELQKLVDHFLTILHLYSVISRKPIDYGTGDKLFFTEIRTISVVGKSKEINMTRLAEKMGVTKGAISQTVRKLVSKNLMEKSNARNRKEFILRLTPKGDAAYKGQEKYLWDIFSFAEKLYDRASVKDRELVKRLFDAIISNMQERVQALETANYEKE